LRSAVICTRSRRERVTAAGFSTRESGTVSRFTGGSETIHRLPGAEIHKRREPFQNCAKKRFPPCEKENGPTSVRRDPAEAEHHAEGDA